MSIAAALQAGAPLSPLAAYKQFILVRLIPQADGSTKKMPVDLSGDAVSAHDPVQWLTATDALTLLSTMNDAHCLGFVFTRNDPFWFLDIDHAWNGSNWSELSDALCRRLPGAAVELSQSGTGMHLFGTGTVPPHGCKNVALGLELYTEGRFVALTGMHATRRADWDASAVMAGIVAEYFPPGVATVGDVDEWRTTPVAEYGPERPDQELIQRILSSRGGIASATGGAPVSDLFTANAAVLGQVWPAEGRPFDASYADSALAMHLAFWTGRNHEQIRRLMLASQLKRDKWSEDVHRTYLERTIKNAVAKHNGKIYGEGRQTTTSEVGPVVPPVPPSEPGIILDSDVAMHQQDWHGAHLSAGSPPKPYGTIENFKALLGKYGLTITYNEIVKEIDIVGPCLPTGGDMRENAVLGVLNSIANLNKYPREAVTDGITVVANENTVNPVRDWVNGKPWDRSDHIGALFATLTLEEDEDRDMVQMLFRRWLMGAIAIGTGETDKFEFALVLVEESGGEGKTRWFNKLCHKAWQKEGLHVDPDEPDSRKAAISTWLVEMGELDSTVNKTDAARLKAFMAASSDELRLPYARTSNKYPRRTAFFGTVNQMCFLLDESSNRRFWPIRVARVDYQHQVDMQQVWAQALAAVKAKERYWLNSDENKAVARRNVEFRAADPVNDRLMIAWPTTGPEQFHMTVTEILVVAGITDPKRQNMNRAATWLREHNFRFCTVKGKRGFWMPSAKISKSLTGRVNY